MVLTNGSDKVDRNQLGHIHKTVQEYSNINYQTNLKIWP